MGKGAAFENSFLKLIFNAVAIANIADNAGSSPLTNLYVSLHTADPTAAGNQTSNEATYTSYARVAVVRTSSGWTVTGNVVSPAALISFPACTGSTNTITYAAVGTLATGTGEIIVSGAVSPSISVATGVTPQLTTASTFTEN